MDKETLLKIVGELYINNYILNEQVKAQADEIIKLKNMIEKTNGQDRN